MKKIYPVFIAECGEDFLVYVPDMEIYTEGKNVKNAIEMARDAIGLKGIALEDEGVDLPTESDVAGAYRKAKEDTDIFDYTQGVLTLVDVDFDTYRENVRN